MDRNYDPVYFTYQSGNMALSRIMSISAASRIRKYTKEPIDGNNKKTIIKVVNTHTKVTVD